MYLGGCLRHYPPNNLGSQGRLTQGHSLLWLSQKELMWGTEDLGSNAILSGRYSPPEAPYFPYLKIWWLKWTTSMSLPHCNILSAIPNSALPPTVCLGALPITHENVNIWVNRYFGVSSKKTPKYVLHVDFGMWTSLSRTVSSISPR